MTSISFYGGQGNYICDMIETITIVPFNFFQIETQPSWCWNQNIREELGQYDGFLLKKDSFET